MKRCNFCGNERLYEIIDLHHQPPSNSFLTEQQLNELEITYPLKLHVCDQCWLVQVPEVKKAGEIFMDDYPYYSSQSPANVSHAKEYVEMMCERFGYKEGNRVTEIGGNDGYLLQHFPKEIEVINIEPSATGQKARKERGILTHSFFFCSSIAESLPQSDLICGINVLAHQPDINDFVEGLRIALKPDGIITMEFPHLMRMVEGMQFDTIYHEHYSYFSLFTLCEIFKAHGLVIFDVDELLTHGGSLRIYVQHQNGPHQIDLRVGQLLYTELIIQNMNGMAYYSSFKNRVEDIKLDIMSSLICAKSEDKTVVAYGAAAKGNTFLNYCGIGSDLIAFAVDRSPYKQNKYLPGSHIPVYGEQDLINLKPEYVLILAWNLKDEIMEQLKYIKEWGGKFIIAIPNLEVI